MQWQLKNKFINEILSNTKEFFNMRKRLIKVIIYCVVCDISVGHISFSSILTRLILSRNCWLLWFIQRLVRLISVIHLLKLNMTSTLIDSHYNSYCDIVKTDDYALCCNIETTQHFADHSERGAKETWDTILILLQF